MKKIQSLLTVLTCLGLVGCGGNTSAASSVAPASSTEETSVVESSSAEATHIDYYLSENCRLAQDYKNHTFMKDGIEQVTLKTCIDGDTAHFYTADNTIVKSRFFGIDTPESTGKVQEWGKPASNFTKKKLQQAAENGTIVISSPSDEYTSPSVDSTGSRYVSLVWISLDTKNADYKDLVLLNLWIVQEGLSYVKNVSDMERMSDDFYAAQAQAEREKLNMFSGEKDELYNYGSYTDVSLLDIKNEVLANMKDSTHANAYDGQKVRVVGTVAGFSNQTLYLQNYYTKDEGGSYEYGEYAGINIYVGMSSIPSKYYKTNTYLQVSGLAQDSENFGFQITDTQFNAYPKDTDDKNARVLISADDNTDEYQLHTFQFKPSELTNDNTEALNCSVELSEDVVVSGGYVSSDATEITLYLKDTSGNSLPFSIFIPFVFHPVDDASVTYSTKEDFIGKKFHVKGVYTYHKATSGKISYQINLSNNQGLVEAES